MLMDGEFMKKIFCIFLLFVIVVGSFSGCETPSTVTEEPKVLYVFDGYELVQRGDGVWLRYLRAMDSECMVESSRVTASSMTEVYEQILEGKVGYHYESYHLRNEDGEILLFPNPAPVLVAPEGYTLSSEIQWLGGYEMRFSVTGPGAEGTFTALSAEAYADSFFGYYLRPYSSYGNVLSTEQKGKQTVIYYQNKNSDEVWADVFYSLGREGKTVHVRETYFVRESLVATNPEETVGVTDASVADSVYAWLVDGGQYASVHLTELTSRPDDAFFLSFGFCS